MIYQQLPSFQQFTLQEVQWTSCRVVCWKDGEENLWCEPEIGVENIKPTIGFKQGQGVSVLISLVPGVEPEPGWKVIGYGPKQEWVCIPPWYIYPKVETPPKLDWKRGAAALAAGFFAVWGGINLLPQEQEGPVPSITYKAK